MKNMKWPRFGFGYLRSAELVLIASMFLVPVFSFAQSSSPDFAALQARINQLTELVLQLQAQLAQQVTLSGSPDQITAAPTDGSTRVPQIAGNPIVACALPELSQGDESNSVAFLQVVLNKEGMHPNGLITGYFGQITRASVVRFQGQNDIPQAGRVGPLTSAALRKKISLYFPDCAAEVSNSITIATTTIPVINTDPEPNVTPQNQNHAPIIASTYPKSATQGQLIQFTVSATDLDNDTLSYSMTNLPSGASFNTKTLSFSWTPSSSQLGLHTPTLTVSDGKTNASQSFIVTVADLIPSPINLSADISDFNQYKRINLAWQTPSAGATLVAGYEIYRGSKLIASTTAPTYQDKGTDVGILLPNISHCYSIIAYVNDYVRSQATSPSCVILPSGTTSAPSNLTGSAPSSNSVQLNWQYPLTLKQQLLDNDIILFVVEKSSDGANWSILNYSRGVGSFTDLTAQPGVKNYYRVTAFSSKTGYSTLSNAAWVDVPPATEVPSAPTELSASFSSALVTTIQLLWKDNSNDETGFSIERFDPFSNSWAQIATMFPHTGDSVQYILSNLPLSTTYTYRVRAYNSVGSSEPSASVSITTPAPLSWAPPDPSDNLLVVYNTNLNPIVSDGATLKTLKDYYLEHRPGISSANVLGVNTTTSLENIGEADFNSTIRAPIVSWLQAPENSNKHIRYIVMMYGMPTRVQSPPYGPATVEFGSVDYRVSRAFQSLNLRSGVEYRSGSNSRYMPDYHQGTTVLVSRLDMGTAEATKAYIDKLSVAGAAAGSGLIISGQSAGVGSSTYYFDDVTISSLVGIGKNSQNAVLAENPSAKTVYSKTDHIFTASGVKGYMTFGANGQIGMDYAIDGKIKFSGKSGWYILQTIESWNGQRFNTGWPGTGQGSFVDWFAKNAFGSANYENTPVGAVSHTSEPGGSGVNSADYFRLWERGYFFIEAAWASRNTVHFMATGDPFVTK